MMDGNLLRSWLGLPPGPWPPDDRTLLGLPEHADPAEVERRALMLMGRLRPHQLMHPELVTEGMNRLAQAMLAVTSFGVSKPSAPQKAPASQSSALAATKQPASTPSFDFAPSATPDPAASPVGPAVLDAEPVVLDAQVVAEAIPEVDDQAPRPRLKQHSPTGAIATTLPPVPELARPKVGQHENDRREAYYLLAGWRGVLEAWEKLAPWLGNPAEEVNTPAAIFDYLEAIQACRTAQQHPALSRVEWAAQAPLVQQLVDHPQTLGLFRSLGYGQRLGLAADWARAKRRWAEHLLDWRLEVRRAAAALPRPMIAALRKWMAHNPEWLLGFASFLVLLAALLRMLSATLNKPLENSF